MNAVDFLEDGGERVTMRLVTGYGSIVFAAVSLLPENILTYFLL